MNLMLQTQELFMVSQSVHEGYVKEFTQRHFIIRSTWVYGEGYNFVNKFIEETKNKSEVTVASDQFGSPTSALKNLQSLYFTL